jgi:RNA polymerase sigma-70 factor (sigma-E family)
MEWLRSAASERQFEAFVSATTDDLVRTGYLMTWDTRETEDLVQETLLKVAARWDRVRRMDHPGAYARRVLVNLVLDHSDRRLRRRSELQTEPVDRIDLHAARPFSEIENASELRTIMAALPRQQRAVLVLRYWEDLSEAETADVLGCSVGTVKKNTWRAVNRLRQNALAGQGASTNCEGENS